MVDLADVAQKSQTIPPPPPAPVTGGSPPPDPAPMLKEEALLGTTTSQSSSEPTYPDSQSSDKEPEDIMNAVLSASTPQAPTASPSTPSSDESATEASEAKTSEPKKSDTDNTTPPSKPSRLPNKGILAAVLLFFLLTIPLGVYFVSQQQQLAETRSQAVDGPYPNGQICTSNAQCASGTCQLGPLGTRNCVPGSQTTPPPGNQVPPGSPPSGVNASIGTDCDDYGTGTQCHGDVTIHICQNGPTSNPPGSCPPGVTSGCNLGAICENPVETKPNANVDCIALANQHCAFIQLDTPNGSAMTCYPTDRSKCGAAVPSPTPPGSSPPPPPPGNPPPPPPSDFRCENIKILKNGTEVAPSSLVAGDQVLIAVTGLNATKARARVNGGAWMESSAKNGNGDYTVPFTVPANTFTFTIESEVFKNGNWE